MIPRRSVLASAAVLGGPGWAWASKAPGLQFPRDFGAHPQTRLEWWYLTGVLHTPSDAGRPDDRPAFGYQLTFFRVLGPAPADHPSALAARQVLIGHVALSDLRQGRLVHDQRLARAYPGVAQAQEGDCHVQMRDWWLRRETGQSGDAPDLSRYVARFQGQSQGQPFGLDLTLQCTQPV